MRSISMYKLKKPLFCTFTYRGATRVEAITHITCGNLGDDETQPDTTPSRGFCDRIVSDYYDPIELAVELERKDVEEGVRAAFLAAKYRAEDWFAALANDAANPDEPLLDIERFKDDRLLAPLVHTLDTHPRRPQ